jgi:hypothetical protein
MIKPIGDFDGGDFADLDAARAFLERAAAEYNRRPHPDLGGLSPEQMDRLLRGDWFTSGPLRVNSDVPPGDVLDADLVVNARTFLAAVQQAGGVRATAAGNLPRKFVGEMLERLRFPSGHVREIRKFHKAINEHDVLVVHALRVVLEVAKLIRRARGRFVLRPAARELLPEAKAATLYLRLFRTVFREFSLAYLDTFGPEAPSLQHTVAFSLYRVSVTAREWRDPEQLAKEIVLPEVYAELTNPHWDAAASLSIVQRVLLPLQWFGLLERKDLPPTEPYDRPYEVRKTRLFDRLIEFRL